MQIINLTPTPATPELLALGVVDVPLYQLQSLQSAYKGCDGMAKPQRESRVLQICGIASHGMRPYPPCALIARDTPDLNAIHRFLVKDLARLNIIAVIDNNTGSSNPMLRWLTDDGEHGVHYHRSYESALRALGDK